MADIKDIRGAEHDPLILEDKVRHDEKIKEAVKKKMSDIISEQDILTGDAKKIVKVKIPSVKERRFIFKDEGESRVADGEGDGDEANGRPKPSTGAGNNPGAEILEETEIKLEDLIDLMLEDLKLEDFTETVEVKPKNKYQPLGKRKVGPYVRLSKKETVKRQIARTRAEAKKQGRENEMKADDKRKFIENDKRYRHIKPIPDMDVKAVLFCVADASGSMDNERIYLARAFYFILARSLKKKGYENVETIFICHDAVAKEVSEAEFFKRAGAGGTNLSSGHEKVLEIMEQRYKNGKTDFYVFHATDGENYVDDNDKLARALEKVCRKSNLVGIAKVKPQGHTFDKGGNAFKKLMAEFSRFLIFDIKKREDVGPALKKFLGRDKGDGK
ncbi:MAG: DUF444 family protein [Patescibacteria group bacterium]